MVHRRAAARVLPRPRHQQVDFENAIGKAVTAEASRARNGSKSGLLRMLTLPDGKVVSACPQNC